MKKPQKAKSTVPDRAARPRPIAASLPKLTAKAIGKHGFTEGSLITEWATIVGSDLAAVSQPEKLAFSRGERVGGVLHIRVQGGVATELQHLEPMVVERINRHFGYGAVTRLRLIHAPLGRDMPRRRHAASAKTPLDPAQKTALSDLLDAVEDDEMRATLERIGTTILQQEAGRKRQR